MTSYSINQLVKCVRREIAYRKRVYSRLVQEGKMDSSQAASEIEMMQAVHDNLENQQQLKLF